MESISIRIFAAIRKLVFRPDAIYAPVRGRDGFSFAPCVVIWITNLLNEDQKFDLNTIPESLKEFMEFYSDQMDISLAHIRMLATMQMREDTAPKTKEHWKILYDAVKGALDRQNNR